ncbi:hypothetical protein BDC45DRAFT_509330 [Circinella umbellata]|nr:hypothetical protein BDC45DRAFT_509330 [Circinella umbellata]
MAYYEADCEDLFYDDDTTINQYYDNHNDQQSSSNTNINQQPPIYREMYNDNNNNNNDSNHVLQEEQQQHQQMNDIEMTIEDDVYDEGAYSDDSEYSLDYEYLGPRNPNYRCQDDPDSDASELSDSENNSNYQQQHYEEQQRRTTTAGFDMWDEDPYSTNDYTWESNDMRLTHFIKFRQNELNQILLPSWHTKSFWRKDKGWPKQLPSSCSTTNHDQAANALCMVLSNYGMTEQLYAIYRNRIFECGRPHIETSSDQFPISPNMQPNFSTNTTLTPTIMTTHQEQQQQHDTLTWIDSDHVSYSSFPLTTTTTTTPEVASSSTSFPLSSIPQQQQESAFPYSSSSSIPLASSSFTAASISNNKNNNYNINHDTNNNNNNNNKYNNNSSTNMGTSTSSGSGSSSSSSSSSSSNSSKFCETHLAVSLRRSTILQPDDNEKSNTSSSSSSSANAMKTVLKSSSVSSSPPTGIARFRPFTKYIQRADFPPVYPQDSYLALDFEPLCLAHKYGYMAIGGLEGEFELYCCMDHQQPRKIWGTKFKSRNNVQLMTNAIQIVRWKKLSSRMQQDLDDNCNNCNDDEQQERETEENDEECEYEYMLIACMNEAGILVYKLPSHHECQSMPACRSQESSSATTTPEVVQLYTHLRCFDHVAVNDAKVSHDGKQMVCVGDDAYVFILDTTRHSETGLLTFGHPKKLHVPCHLLKCNGGSGQDMPYSSQYVAWSQSSRHFAHTSDTHNNVFVWRADTKQVLYSIDAGGYTYAISFHPRLEGVLAFTNRYGYFHTVNLEEAKRAKSNEVLNILDFDHQTSKSRGHMCTNQCIYSIAAATTTATRNSNINDKDYPANHTTDMHAHQEITMVSFRGERDRRLRILAKINGIQWSNDGRYLYVATKKRILAYEFMKTAQNINTLLDITGKQARGFLERFHRQSLSSKELEEEANKELARRRRRQRRKKAQVCTLRRKSSRKRKRDENDENNTKLGMVWLEKWLSIPSPIRHRILGETQLASHW